IDRPGRISFFLDEPNPIPGAPWTRIKSFAKAFVAKKHDVDLIGIFGPTSLERKGINKIENIAIFNLIFKIPLNHPLVFLLNVGLSFISSVPILLARRPKIAIVSFPGGDSGSGFLITCSFLRIKYIVDYRDEWENQLIYASQLSKFTRGFYRFIKRTSIFYYKRALFVSAVTIPFVVDLKKKGITCVMHFPNGAVTSSFKPVDRKPHNEFFSIIYSGGVGEYYRIDVVLSALKILADKNLKNIRLLIVGRGTNEHILYNLQKYSQQLGIQNSLVYLGNKSNVDELSKIIAEADVGIIPFDDNLLWKNALTAKFFEYCSSGLPVIATVFDDSLLAKVIGENKIGLTAHPLDHKGLAEVIEKIYWDKKFRESAGKRARILVEQHYDRNKISEEFLNAVCKAAKC
ncbi:MAG: glycosyltransferase, partial [Methanobacteriaceae archaeon]